MSDAVGVDIGGTKIAAALVGDGGTVVAQRQRPTPAAAGAAAVLATVAELVREVAGETRPDVVGVGTAGVVDAQTGEIVSATAALAGWAGTAVAAALEAALGCPVTVENDVNAFAYAEAAFGAARGQRDVLGVAVGTGIGAGLLLDGALVRGSHHSAGALGHMPVLGADGLACPCGAVGHLEAIASGPAMAGRYAQLRRAAGRDDGAVPDLRSVRAVAQAGDELAQRVVRDGAVALGAALGGVVNLLDPQVVVLGGGVVLAFGQSYMTAVEQACRDHLLPGVRDVPLLSSALGAHAGAIGAAALALSRRGPLS